MIVRPHIVVTCDANPRCDATINTRTHDERGARGWAERAGWTNIRLGRTRYDLCPRHNDRSEQLELVVPAEPAPAP